MAGSRRITSVSTLQKGAVQYPLTSDEFVFLANGRNCPHLSIRSRCIPLVGMRRLRSTYDACLSHWGVLWQYYVLIGWTTREILLETASYGITRWLADKASLD